MMSLQGLLTGKTAVVTGATGLLGRETAIRLANAGAAICLADLDEDKLISLASFLKEHGHQIATVPLDLRDEDSVKACADFCARYTGSLDIVVNNAGIVMFKADTEVANLDIDTWDETIAVNARGTMLMSKHCLPYMIATGDSSIVNISSISSLAGDRTMTAYAASKAAINQLTRHLATTYGRSGVRANAVAVGVVERLARTDPNAPDGLAGYRAHTLLDRLCRPSDVANSVLFLTSALSSMMTGQVLTLDGGYLTHEPAAEICVD